MVRSVARILYLVLGSLFINPSLGLAQIQLSPVASGLSSPLFVTHAGDGSGRLFIVEQPGTIKVLSPGNPQPTVFLDLTAKTDAVGERGLLGLAFHPDYAINGRFFVFYTRASTDLSLNGDLVIAEYGASPPSSNVAATTETVLLTIEHSSQSNHNGGMVAFGPDRYLYLGVGDGGAGNDPPNNAQNINNLLGKILRIAVNPTAAGAYGIPPDNPFVGVAGADEIFAYGMRNPWRFSFDRCTSDMYVADVGQGRLEEVDFEPANAPAGGNYGWRLMEGDSCFNPATDCNPNGDLILPVATYGRNLGQSITGGFVYRASTIPALRGTYFYADYSSARFWSLRMQGGTAVEQQEITDDLNPGGAVDGISSFGTNNAGEVFVTSLSGGTVYRIDAE